MVGNAAVNRVPLPDGVGAEAAAVLGCRFATSFRAVTAVGRVRPGEHVVVDRAGRVRGLLHTGDVIAAVTAR